MPETMTIVFHMKCFSLNPMKLDAVLKF